MEERAMRSEDELQALADKCRRLAADIHDDLVAKGLLTLADEYELLAMPQHPTANSSDGAA